MMKPLSSQEQDTIDKTVEYVRQQLEGAEAGHDWWHIKRVWNNTRLLLLNEPDNNRLVCELAALLHDIADSKFHEGNEEIGPRKASDFLISIGVEDPIVKHVKAIIENMSYSTSLGGVSFHSKELEIVQDADRLDALGAIGIARAFHYGGFKNRLLYDPSIEPAVQQDKTAYKNSQAPTINHFYEKLLLLKSKMNTVTAKQIAEQRHQYMEGFLHQFFSEWDGEMTQLNKDK